MECPASIEHSTFTSLRYASPRQDIQHERRLFGGTSPLPCSPLLRNAEREDGNPSSFCGLCARLRRAFLRLDLRDLRNLRARLLWIDSREFARLASGLRGFASWRLCAMRDLGDDQPRRTLKRRGLGCALSRRILTGAGCCSSRRVLTPGGVRNPGGRWW